MTVIFFLTLLVFIVLCLLFAVKVKQLEEKVREQANQLQSYEQTICEQHYQLLQLQLTGEGPLAPSRLNNLMDRTTVLVAKFDQEGKIIS